MKQHLDLTIAALRTLLADLPPFYTVLAGGVPALTLLRNDENGTISLDDAPLDGLDLIPDDQVLFATDTDIPRPMTAEQWAAHYLPNADAAVQNALATIAASAGDVSADINLAPAVWEQYLAGALSDSFSRFSKEGGAA
ncbi:hypothetical protein [Halochromatium salexigens]|uniref:Uncharacterized protein n=1 Tax=Halochromatium salexigens TaxID=49447 RepID=A0AAJ0UE46_HALSE|nr:hypothetical protein [Halochromatium salexigens]MBK5929633.1 hypothetical protein [Halochromatium salexigens]